jgi:hypothetical protein
MTAISPAGAAQQSWTRRAGPWILLLVGLLIVALIAGAPRQPEGEAFDPASTSGNGTKALVELLGEFGARVDVTGVTPAEDAEVALLFTDVLDETGTAAAQDWVLRGGTLIVADPFSGFAPEVAGTTGSFGVAPTIDREMCDIAALQDLAVVDPGGAVRYDVPVSADSCFGDDQVAFAVRTTTGEGAVVALGGGDLFTNERLADADNAAVAARLLAPERGVRVALLQPGAGEGSSDRSLTDVVGIGVRLGFVQLVLGFLAYAWYRARRLGQPVVEAQPVDIAGSELVLAVGQLLQQAKSPQRAADLLRSDVRRRVAERLGLPAGMPPDDMVDVVAARTGIEPERVRAGLGDGPVLDDAALLDLAQDVDALRQEILHGH